MAPGWHASVLEVGGDLIFKFPRSEAAEAALHREAALLELISPVVRMRVPHLTLHRSSRLFSRHEKLPGDHLLAEQYQRLPEVAREALAADLANFYAELHQVDHQRLRTAGALPIEPWQRPDEIRSKALPLLPAALQVRAATAVQEWEGLEPDPHGVTFGFFDGHGWNFAFDHDRQQLGGIYDFGDAGFGELHQEFIYSNLISRDLTERLVPHYERLTGRHLDRQRIALLTDIHRLSELAELAEDAAAAAEMLRYLQAWWQDEALPPLLS